MAMLVSSPQTAGENDLIPIVFGVTGHRDLRKNDLNKLENLIRNVFLEFRMNYPNTPFTLLSPLVEGADRLVAKVALDEGVTLIATLPMNPYKYQKTFQTKESVEEYQTLLKRAKNYYEIPHEDIDLNEHLEVEEELQTWQSRVTSAYVAKQCHILIALWDGCTNDDGTSDIITMKRNGMPTPVSEKGWLLKKPEQGAVYQIVTPRNSCGEAIYKPMTGGRIDDHQVQAFHHRVFQDIDIYNSDAKKYALGNLDFITSDLQFVDQLPRRHREIVSIYAFADGLAKRFQKKRKVNTKFIFLIVFLAALSYSIYTNTTLLPAPLSLASYPVILLIGSVFYQFVNKKQSLKKHLEYRALAEGMRVLFFWNYLGVDHQGIDDYLNKQIGELGWIRFSLRAVYSRNAFFQCHDSKDPLEKKIEFVDTHWVIDQVKFYDSAKTRDTTKVSSTAKVSKWLLVVDFIFTCVLLGLDICKVTSMKWIHILLVVLIGLVPVLIAIFEGYDDKMAVSSQSKRYSEMYDVFQWAREQLQTFVQRKDYEKAKQVVVELGKEALIENGDWVLMHKERPLQPPKA